MTWNIAPECTSAVILCIIWVYSRKGNPLPSLKNRLFQACFLVTFCAMLANILSTLLIYHLGPGTLVWAWIITLLYYIATPLMGLAYYLYTLATIQEENPQVRRAFWIGCLPGAVYVAMVLINPISHILFDLTLEGGYQQGPLRMVTYVIFYLYCLAGVLAVLLWGRRVAPSIRAILFVFPLIAAGVIVVQLYIPDIILSGSAATSALLLIYLFLQNKQLSIDHLTRLPNRQAFLSMVEMRLKKGGHFTILVLSLREFKEINDAHGQQSGDVILAEIASWLRHGFPHGTGQIFRYGGDEFAILLDNANGTRVDGVLAQVEARMAEPWCAMACTVLIDYGIGVVYCPESANYMAGLVNGIEYAVARAKQNKLGKRTCHCTPALLEEARRRQTVLDLMRRGLEGGVFEVYYQPILAVGKGTFPVAEALLRMPNTPLGPIFPDEFIPIAEESGLIIEITYLVLETVCAQIRRLLDAGIALAGISVNLSTLQFSQPDLMERICRTAERHGIPCSMIKLEITESTLAHRTEAVVDFVCQAKARGIRIGLDDFGTGYSNLTSVIGLPLDTVKLDKSLVWAAMDSGSSAIMVRNITRAFLELGQTVLAEGVENDAQAAFVAGCGCGLIQGFLYARPMPGADYEAFLRQRQF